MQAMALLISNNGRHEIFYGIPLRLWRIIQDFVRIHPRTTVACNNRGLRPLLAWVYQAFYRHTDRFRSEHHDRVRPNPDEPKFYGAVKSKKYRGELTIEGEALGWVALLPFLDSTCYEICSNSIYTLSLPIP